jgi:surface antigen
MAPRFRHALPLRTLIGVVFALACGAAHAQFVALLKNGPAELFDDMDLRIFLDTARRTLDQGELEKTVAWNNPDTGHGGDFTIVKRFESKGRPCQLLRVRNQAQGRKSDMRHNLCMVDGRWRLVGDLKTGAPK